MKTIEDLMKMMEQLRRDDGCPWDREQTFKTLGPMLVEEAYEVIEAAESEDWNELRDELGDMLFQLVFYGQIAAENGWFTLHDSITRVYEKMWRRHPHVFGEQKADTTAEVLANWEAIKAAERRQSGKKEKAESGLLDGVSTRVPGLLEAHQLTSRAARVGFDWADPRDVFAKLDEEISELQEELSRVDPDPEALAGEMGDLLFVAVNLARKLGVEPESALKTANRKFRRRFRHVEKRLEETGRSFSDSTLQEMDSYWDEAKVLESTREKGA